MSLRSALLSAVALATFPTSRADLGTCGRWHTASTCEVPDMNPFEGGYNATIQFQGTVSGQMYMDLVIYDAVNCSGGPLLYAHVNGIFDDLGPVSEELQNLRKFAINLTFGDVVPESDLGASIMAGLCPCNGTDPNAPSPWTNGGHKIITGCDPNNCDLQFLGGETVRFNQPVFTTVNVSDDGGFSMGQLDIDPRTGFTNPVHLTYPTSEAACVTTSTADLCGAFMANTNNVNEDMPCEVLLDPWNDTLVGSRTVSFNFRGPPSDEVVFDAYGVYRRESDYFSDPDCRVLEATVYEEGSMGYFMRGITSGLNIVEKVPASFVVVPANTAQGWATVTNLTQKCGCGDAPWRAGTPRSITSCPTGTCETPIFNDFNPPGLSSYAYVARNTTTLETQPFDVLAFGSWNTSTTRLDSSGLKYAMLARNTMQNYCEAASYTDVLCGSYSTACSVDRTGYDTQKEVILSGITSNSSSEGKITYRQTLFASTGNGCQQSDATFVIKGTGFFSQDTNADNPNVVGLYSVDVDFTAVEITPMSQAATNEINQQTDGCPCGGTWVLGSKRTLFTCPTGTCSSAWMSGILPGGVFGQPGYGVMQLHRSDDILRISQLMTDRDAGYSQGFDVQTTLLRQESACPVANHPADFRGCWVLPCYRVDAGSSYYALSGTFDSSGADDTSGLFFLNRSIYAANSGCTQTDAQLIDIAAEGAFTRSTTASKIVGGQVVSLNIFYVIVTPVSAAGAEVLASECRACDQNWQAGVPITFTDTPCECAILNTMAGIPLQKGLAHGVTKIWDYSSSDSEIDNAFKMTTFSRSVASITSATFTRADGEFARTPDDACRFAPPAGPSSAGGGGSGGLQGGDVFILLVFLSTTVYFGGGMVMNYQRTGGRKNGGTPTIPHLTFWRGLPSLVADGFRFVFVERFGTAAGGGSNKYKAFGGPSGGSEGGYGAL